MLSKVVLLVVCFVSFSSNAWAEGKRSPDDVYGGIYYIDKMVDIILEEKGITVENLPKSREGKVLPMHVYELHLATLKQVYIYSLDQDLTPPPLPVSTPIRYSADDVYLLTDLLSNSIERMHESLGLFTYPDEVNFSDKALSDVYDILYRVYSKIFALNGKKEMTHSDVFAQVIRVKEDLRDTLLVVSKRLPPNQEANKRKLLTATYGISTDGDSLNSFKPDLKPTDLLGVTFGVRNKLNLLRKKHGLEEIAPPTVDKFGEIRPEDVFLQTQFIIAELNSLKFPLKISNTTNSAKAFANKSPTHVYEELAHVEYMLDRLLEVQ